MENMGSCFRLQGELDIVLQLGGRPHVTAGEMIQELDGGSTVEAAAWFRAEAWRVRA